MKKQPNVFLFIIDAVRYDVFGIHGYRRPTTPFLEHIAQEGVFFSNAYTASTWTLPSHVTFLTGLSTFQHTVDYNLNRRCPYPNPFLFLPQLLKPTGYKTALISEQVFLTPALYADKERKQMVFPGFLPPDCCGFDFVDSIFDYTDKKSLRVQLPRVRDPKLLVGVASTKTRTNEAEEHWKTFDRQVQEVDTEREIWPNLETLYRRSPYISHRYQCLEEFLKTPPEGQERSPLFVMTNLHTGQLSFEPEIRKTWFQQYFKENLHIELAREKLDFFELNDAEWLDDTISISTWEILHAFDLMFMDCTIRLLYEYYQHKNLLTDDDTFIFVTDHGLGKAETKLSFRNCHHGAYPFEWLLRMPLIVRGPGFGAPGQVVENMVSALDIYPTIAAAAGVEIPAPYRQQLRGKSLQERLAKQDFETTDLVEVMIYVNKEGVCLLPKETTLQDNWSRHQQGYCFVDGPYRLICIPTERIVQLFDIENDPLYKEPIQETQHVAPIITKMQKQLEQRQASAKAAIAAVAASSQAASQTTAVATEEKSVKEPEEKVVASLKALGYY